MVLRRPFRRFHRRKRASALGATLVVGVAAAHEQALAQSVASTPTLPDSGSADMANLPAIPAGISCAQLAQTTQVNGQKIQIVKYQTARASASSPKYCAVTGHINTYIGFGWSGNAQQRVDFAYLSYHDVAEVSKGLAQRFYGTAPRYSYFDGCSQGGHEALGEIQRYPADFNGVLAGAPASITTELNSVLHEYTYEANYTEPGYSGKTILDQPEATILLSAALKACDPKTGLMLDDRACEQKFNLKSVACSAKLKTNCLTPAQLAVVRKVLAGPVDQQGQLLYPGGYSLSSSYDWSDATSVNLPLTPGGTVTPATFITNWLQYLTFETSIGATAVKNEPFTKAYFEKIEKLAPFWDANDPDLRPFEQAGGKLILWQGEADYSIPFATSVAYYQAVAKASGGLSATRQFARYYALPGVGHCGGNGPDSYNGIGAVVAWSEKHVAPQALLATQYVPAARSAPAPPSASDLTDTVPVLGAPSATAKVRQLEIYPYPELPAYKGYGNVDQASSYTGKVSRALEKPIRWLGKFDRTLIWCNSKGTNCRETRAPV